VGEAQRTLARAATCEGTGLHTGAFVHARISPAPPDSGIVFVRTDLPGRPRIAVLAVNRIAQPRRTVIEASGAEVNTVEHLVSAAVGLGIDNLEIEVDGPEAPGFDGSAAGYVELLRGAGVVDQTAPPREVVLEKPVRVEGRHGAFIAAEPWPHGLRITYSLDYPLPELRNQRVELDLTEDAYVRELASARTFCLRQEAEMLRAAGLGKGATFDNTVVYDEDGTVGNVKLRFPDEAARHKLLDLVGDLALLGARLRAHVTAAKSGHDLNLELVRAILAQTPDRV
jgi:UDP-3-O-acyl N-acetylglucosamine deacetylase